MRILWLGPEPPVPPLSGGRERARQMLAHLAQRHEVYWLGFAGQAEAPAVQALTQLGLTAHPAPYPRSGHLSRPLFTFVTDIVKAFAPEVIHLQGLDLWPYRPQGIPMVLDLHDIPGVLAERLNMLDRSISFIQRWRHSRLEKRVASQEKAALARATHVVVPSAGDGDLLRLRHPWLPPITVIPNGVDLSYWTQVDSAVEHPRMLFPGALNGAVNVDAATVMIEQVLPRIRRALPAAELVVAGRQPNARLGALIDRRAGVVLAADPLDMRPFFAAAQVIVVPIRVATGTRLKILQALASGRPVVSTPAGARGLALAEEEGVTIAPLLEPFVEQLLSVLQSPEYQQRISARGAARAREHDWTRFLPLLDTIYP